MLKPVKNWIILPAANPVFLKICKLTMGSSARNSLTTNKIRAMGQGIIEFSQGYPNYFRMLSYSGSERFCNADNDDAKEILELTNRNISLMRDAFEQGMKDGTVRDDINPLEMALYLCITSLSIMNLDPRWEKALKAAEINHDRFKEDCRRFIGPSIESSRKANAACSTSDM